MARLSDDCFAAGDRLMTTDETLALMRERIAPVAETETLPLRAARGRILARDLVSALDVPPHDNSAVDGYAFRHADLNANAATAFTVAGRAAAGHPFAGTIQAGEAVRIFTGAVMPHGLDTVAMQEDCTVAESRVTIPPGLTRGANRRAAGEDIAAGRTILAAGHRLRPQDIGLAAAAGIADLQAFRMLRVAIFSTGDEVVELGRPLPAGAVYDSNRYILATLLDSLGCIVDDLGILPDDAATIAKALEEAGRECDLVLTSGGVSVGEEDHVRRALEARGHLHFWRLAIKPGRPLAMGQIGRAAFVGIPGNPVAVMVTFLRFIRPLILLMGGAHDIAPHLFQVRAAFAHRKKANHREWLRARIVGSENGIPTVEKFARDGAGILTSMVESDGLVELAEETTHLKPGTVVPFLPFSEVLS